jgi:hypothetical protein
LNAADPVLATDCHALRHGGIPGGPPQALSLGIAWHVKHYAYLIQKFRDTPEAGGTMLDNLVMPMLWEGGHGFDLEQCESDSSHSTQNVAVIVGRPCGRPEARPAR